MGTTKILIYGDQIDFHLLKLAIDCAATGNQVWFFTPEPFKSLPKDLGFPEQAVLKLIRFFYLKDCFCLLKHLTEIQSWMKVPCTLIVHKFNFYLKHDCLTAGYLLWHLVDGINHCAKRLGSHCHLILGCDYLDADNNILQKIVDLYIDKVASTDDIYQVYYILKLEY